MEWLEIVKAVVLGIIQGITEWLPISSTGHMILVEEFIRFQQSAEFMEMFRVVIQFGSILAVVLLYFTRLNPFSSKKSLPQKKGTFNLWIKVLIACVPAGIFGILLNDWLDAVFYKPIPVAIALIVYGVAFILLENRNRRRLPSIDSFKKLDYKTALFIGIFQMLALIPGTSRSGSTILGAMLLGTSRQVAAEFSFFLAIPVMLGASLIKLLKFGFQFTGIEIAVLLTGMAVAFLVSVFAIKFLMSFIKKHNFKPFGWYRILLGAVVILYFALTGNLTEARI